MKRKAAKPPAVHLDAETLAYALLAINDYLALLPRGDQNPYVKDCRKHLEEAQHHYRVALAQHNIRERGIEP